MNTKALTFHTIGNSNYETSETEVGQAVHAAYLAVRSGQCQYVRVVDAVAALEETLSEELTESGEFENGIESEEAIDAAEAEVVAAWVQYLPSDEA